MLIDNVILVYRTNNKIEKLNWLVLNTKAEIAEIKDIIAKATTNFVLEYTKGKPSITKLFIKDPNPYLITICHNKAS